MGFITCLTCGIQAHRSGGLAIRCLPCSSRVPRIAQPGRVRNGYVPPLKLNGAWCCVECNAELPQQMRHGRKLAPGIRCATCRSARAKARNHARTAANQAVARAVATGRLTRPSAHACADCGKPAAFYDHRDYTQPLKVDPVCRSCNVMRGPADVWPAPTPEAQESAHG